MAITAAQLLVRIGADTREAERGMESVSARLHSFSRDAALTGAALTAGVSLPLVGVARTALNTAADYESALSLMQAVSGATDEQIQVVAETAKRLGADMSLPATSAADAARAMVELSKAGLSVNDTLTAAQGVLQLAAAGNLSEAAAAEIAANTLGAFRLSGERATDIANLLAAAANASSAEVTDLSDSLKMSSAVFASAGFTAEDLVAAIAQMANAGIKGSDAGTSLKQMILSLQAPSDKASRLMKDLGINIYDAQGKMRPLGDIIAQFSARLGGLTQEQRNQALATIFGSDAVRAANVVLMGGAEAHEQMRDAVTRQGAAAELAGARMKGLGGAFQGLWSQVETALLEIAEPFLGVLEGVVRWVADLISKISELDPNIRNAALAFAGVLAAAGPVLLILSALSGAFAFLASPIGLIVLAVGALAAAWATNFGGIRDITQQVFGAIAAKVQEVWPTVQAVITQVIATIKNIIESALAAIRAFWSEHGDEIMAKAQIVWDMIRSVVDVTIRSIADIVQMVLNKIREFWAEHGAEITDAANRVWNTVWTIVGFVLGLVGGLIKQWVDVVTGVWHEHGDTIVGIFQNIWNIIKSVVEIALDLIMGIIRVVTAIICGDWEGAWTAVQDTALAIWENIVTIVRSLLEIIRGTISVYLDVLRDRWQEGWAAISAWVSEIWEKIRTGIAEKLENIRGKIEEILSGIRDRWQSIWNSIRDSTVSVWTGIVSGIRSAVNGIIGGINGLIDAWNRIEFRIPGFSVTIPSVNVPGVGRVGGGQLGWPGLSVGTADIGLIPLLAKGGLVTRPTLAMLGEAGPEIVLPLRHLDILATRIADAVAGRPAYTINAYYRYQDERSIRDDLRILQLLGASV